MRKIAYWSIVLALGMVFLSRNVYAQRGLGYVDIYELNIQGTKVTSTATEINVLDGIGATLTYVELDYLDITTLGTAQASKVITSDASLDTIFPSGATHTYQSGSAIAAESGSTVNVAGTWQIGGVTVTPDAAEHNILNGVTGVVAADLTAIGGMDGNLSVTGTQIDILTGFTLDVDDVGGLKVGNVATSWSAAESNILTGVTGVVAADLTAIGGMDGNLSVTGTQIDILTGFTLDVDDVGGFKIGNVAVSPDAAEINILNGVTGVVAADLTACGGFDGNISVTTTQTDITTGTTFNVVDVAGFEIGDVAVTPDAAEINILDGVAGVVAADISAIADLDGNMSVTGTQIDILTGFTFDVDDVGGFKIANVAVSPDAAEINILDGVTGTVAADITAIAGFDGNISVTTTQTDITTATTFNVVDVGAFEIGDVAVAPDAAELNILDGVAGVVAADITAIAGFDGNISVTTTQTDITTGTTFNVVDVGGFEIGDVSVDADGREITAACDASARMVTSAGTENITVAAHAGRIVLLTGAGALTRTLPAATGTGNIYRFVVGVVNASHIITVNAAPGTDTIDGGAIGMQDGGDTVEGWECVGAFNTVTLNGTTTGGQIGDWVEIIDIAAGQFSVTAQITQTGAQATPFS